jgi:FkbM family methyltransferase
VTLFGTLRPVVDRWLPGVSTVYREFRDHRAFLRQSPIPTAYGVKLMGHAGMEAGVFEPRETEVARRRLADADVFVDVGANIGLYTCLARALQKQVIAIEPLPRNLEYLYANLRANGFNDVEVFPLAVGAAPGLATLFGAATGASLIRGWADAPAPMQRTIPLSTLDTLLGDRFHGRRLLIKIDVEGGELGVLTGAVRTLARTPAPVWIVEITAGEMHPGRVNVDRLSVFRLLENAGYRAEPIDGSNYIFERGHADVLLTGSQQKG